MVNQKQSVLNWLKAGAVWKDGVLLFKALFGSDHPFIFLIKKGGSELKYQVLKQALSNYANSLKSTDRPEPERTKLRDDYQFLNKPGCPTELKILVADKITAYHNYVAAHQKLFDCTSIDEYYTTVSQVVENYIENQSIHKELDYYKQHQKVYGKHPVFKLYKRIEEFKNMTLMQLIQLKKNLEHSIWRIKDEIKKGTKPHLYIERLQSIKYKEQEIIEISRILERYV